MQPMKAKLKQTFEKFTRSSPSKWRHNNGEDEDVIYRPMTDEEAAYKAKREEEETYIVRQQYGYMSIAFSIVQTLVLIVMMWKCGVAPLRQNPMIGPYPGT